jgi:hypothetical protein
MRPLFAVLVFIGLLAGILSLGRVAFWGEAPNDSLAAGLTPISVEGSIGAEPVKLATGKAKKAAAKKAAAGKRPDARAPRERLIGRDMRIARQAVLRASDMQSLAWTRARLGAEGGPGCPANRPDLSRFTITGKARSAFEGGDSRIDSRVTVFANASQAALFFQATSNRTVLRCIRDGVKRSLRKGGLKPRVLYARLLKEPAIGSQTTIYVIGYELTLSSGRKMEYPLDLLTFQVGRSVAGLGFNLISSEDDSRPCPCELEEARLVASRLD